MVESIEHEVGGGGAMTTDLNGDRYAASSRGRAVIGATIVGIGARAIGIVAPIIVTPQALDYLGAGAFGLWAAVTAASATLVFADLGVGSGVMTRLTAALARVEIGDSSRQGPPPSAETIIGSGYLAVGLLGLLGATAALVGGWWSWTTGFWTWSDEPAVAFAIVVGALTAFCVNLPASMVHRAQFATQRGALSNGWQALGGVVTVLGVLAAIRADVGSAGVVLASLFAVPLVNIVNSVVFFGWIEPGLRPHVRLARRVEIRNLLGLGIGFSVVAALSAAPLAVDAVLTASTLGLGSTSELSLGTRLLAPVTVIAASLTMPLWTAFGAAVARGQYAWARRAVLLAASASWSVVLAGGLGISWLSPWLFDVWLIGDQAVPTPGTVAGLAVSASVMAGVAPFLALLSSRSAVGLQIAGLGAAFAVSIPVKVLALERSGLVVIGWATAAIYFLALAPVCWVALRQLPNERVE